MRRIHTEIKIFEDSKALADNLASDFQRAVYSATNHNQRFTVALSGGSTPVLFFQRLASAPYRDNFPWESVHFLWGDERCVPPDHPESNYGMTKKHLFDRLSVSENQIHRIRGEDAPPSEAIRYSQEISEYVVKHRRGLPRFDWIFLGLGTDGHTASIFPGSDILNDQRNICTVATHPESGQIRITLTLPVINQAERVTFIVLGEKKVSMMARIFGAEKQDVSVPASFVKPDSGRLEWVLDQAAGVSVMNENRTT